MMREVQPISRREERPWVPKGVQRTHGVIRGDMSLCRRPGHLSHPRTEATPGDAAANVQAETAGGTLRDTEEATVGRRETESHNEEELPLTSKTTP